MEIDKILLNAKLDLIKDILLFNDLYKSKSILIEIKQEYKKDGCVYIDVSGNDISKNKNVSTKINSFY